MKYKCNCCGHEFESNEKNPKCPDPDCGCDDVVRVSTFPWKIVLIVGAVVFVIIMIAVLAGGGKGDKPKISPSQGESSLVVTISGPLHDKCQVELKRDSDNKKMSASTKRDKENNSIIKTFKNLASAEMVQSYTLTVWCKDRDYKHKSPKKEPYYTKSFYFQKLDKVPTLPQITAVNQYPKRLSKKTETYTVTIVIDTTCKDNVEYSIDNSRWQSSNVFKGLQPNSYTFYARNTRDKNLVDSKSLTLDPFSSIPIPSINQLNDWLSNVANGDQASLDNLRNIIGRSSIKGVANISDGDGLINDASIKGTVYRVVDMSVKDGVIESVTIN